MGLSVGIVGLPNVGKSTIFNALTAAGAQSANYPFCTIEPNVGIVPVVDPRLVEIADFAGSKQVLFTDLKVVDIAGLVRGASKGEGLGNQFLANIRETDAIRTSSTSREASIRSATSRSSRPSSCSRISTRSVSATNV